MAEPGLDHHSTTGNCKDTAKGNYLQQTEHGNKEKVDIPDHSNDFKDAKANQNSRYANTFKVFQQTGLLGCTLQTAKLIKENEKLQEKINELQRKVNKAAQKTAHDFSFYQKRLAMRNKAIAVGVNDRLNSSSEIRPNVFRGQANRVEVRTNLQYSKAGTVVPKESVRGASQVSRMPELWLTKNDQTVMPNKSNLCKLDLNPKPVMLDARPSSLSGQDVNGKAVMSDNSPSSSFRPDLNSKPVMSDPRPSNLPKPDTNIKPALSDVNKSPVPCCKQPSLNDRLPALIPDLVPVSDAKSVTCISDLGNIDTSNQDPTHVVHVCNSKANDVLVVQDSSAKEVAPNSNGSKAKCNKEKTKEHP